ncbi:uncharacterized protein LOC144539533 isoform X2 [Centroberyx gerrardi]
MWPNSKCAIDYVDELMDLIFDHVFQDPAPYVSQVFMIPVPEDPCAQSDRPAKEDVIAATCLGSIKRQSEPDIAGSIRELTAYAQHHTHWYHYSDPAT